MADEKLINETVCIKVQDDIIPQRSMMKCSVCLRVPADNMDIFKTEIEKLVKGIEGFKNIDLEYPGGICKVLVHFYIRCPETIYIDVDQTDSEAISAVVDDIKPRLEQACLDVLKEV